jgi:hypothetical protein
MSQFPAVDAVIVTHEHEDHFHIPSLNLVDRRIPIVLSGGSSVAAREILAEMGFHVRLWSPGECLGMSSLELHSFAPDHVHMANGDEWDAFGFLVRDKEEDGCFFTNVDVLPSDSMLDEVRMHCQRPGDLLVFRDEQMYWTSDPEIQTFDSIDPVRSTISSEAMDVLLQRRSLLLTPGQSIAVRGGQLCRVDPSTPFLRCPPSSEWPPRPDWRFSPASAMYEPACKRWNLTDAEMDELGEELNRFAEYLYGGTIFRSLYSLSVQDTKGKRPTLIFLLMADEDNSYICFEYEPSRCKFRSVTTSHPEAEYVCGVECWGTDLLALFQGDFEPRILAQGHSRQWASQGLVPDLFLQAIFPFFHPLRRPVTCLRGYRKKLATLKPDSVIRANNQISQRLTDNAFGPSISTQP